MVDKWAFSGLMPEITRKNVDNCHESILRSRLPGIMQRPSKVVAKSGQGHASKAGFNKILDDLGGLRCLV